MLARFENHQELLDESPTTTITKAGKTSNSLFGKRKKAIGMMLAREGNGKVEHAIYYLSKKSLPYESNYNLVKKTYLTMI